MDLPELIIKKPAEDPYSTIAKTEEQIKKLMNKDKILKKIKLKVDPTRDVSHIRDKFLTKKKIPLLTLPTEIQQLKSLMLSSNSKGIQLALSPQGTNTLTCTHKDCVERVVSINSSRKLYSVSSSRKLASINSSPALDNFHTFQREFLGSPTGVQEIESLYEWFKIMKNKCEDNESTEVVYTMCARELLRQVSVQSTLRGKLFQEIIELQPAVFAKK